jgi:hypothetical protein
MKWKYEKRSYRNNSKDIVAPLLKRVEALIIFTLLSYGCNASVEREYIEASPTLAITPTLLIESTFTMTPESVPTSLNILMTETLTPTNEPTWTPAPTLSQEKKNMNLLELLSPNRDCEFPCWWGIRPGTSIQEALSLSSVLGESPYIYTGQGKQYSYTLSLDELNLPDLYIVFYENEEIIQRIEVSLGYPSRLTGYLDALEKILSLSSVLSNYGQPTDVLLMVKPRVERDAPIGYTLSIIYESSGFGIEYSGVVDAEEPIQICSIKLNDYHLETITLYLQDPQAMSSYRSKLLREGGVDLQRFKPLESVTSMSLDAFFQTFSSSENDSCIETSIDEWN